MQSKWVIVDRPPNTAATYLQEQPQETEAMASNADYKGF